MGNCPENSRLNGELLDAFGELIGRLLGEGEKLAERFGVPLFAVKAMHWLDGGGLPMKELGRRMRCDPSFVTLIADSLEKRNLAKREPSPADRRIKNLVLTDAGRELAGRLDTEMLAHMPWCSALDLAERQELLSLVRKLLAAQSSGQAEAGSARQPPEAGPAEAGAARQPETVRPGG